MIRIQWTTQSFIEKASLIHSNKYNYDKVEYINNKTKVKIVCSIHGEFQQTPLLHIGQQTQGCPKCGIIQRSSKNRRTTEQFIEESKAIHGDRYDYSKSEYRSCHKKLTIICNLHGEFQLTPEHHFRKVGCAKCGTIRSSNFNRISQAEIIKRAILTHNYKYSYDKVIYIDYDTKIIIDCHLHGEFTQTPNNHIGGAGCSKCVGRISKVGTEWINMIRINRPFLEMEYRIPNTRYIADGFDPITNTIYEFYGDYWHGNPKRYAPNEINIMTKCTMEELYEKTMIRKNKCIELGYKYVEIWESQWTMFKSIIIKRQRITRQ